MLSTSRPHLKQSKAIPKGSPIALAIAAAAMLLGIREAIALPVTVNLGTADSFAVAAGQGITVAGAVNSTVITGDIGTFPNPAITGLGNVVLNGANQADNAVTQIAKNDIVTAYNDAASRIADVTYSGGSDLVGQTLVSGVYGSASSLFVSGTLTLDAQGDPNAVWIFQAGSTLITASSTTINLINGAQACHVFWQVGSSATLGSGTDFVGNILALTSIGLDTGATIEGRLLAQNGSVTLDNNVITLALCDDTGGTGGSTAGGTGGTTGGSTAVPDGGNTVLLLGAALGTLGIFRRKARA